MCVACIKHKQVPNADQHTGLCLYAGAMFLPSDDAFKTWLSSVEEDDLTAERLFDNPTLLRQVGV